MMMFHDEYYDDNDQREKGEIARFVTRMARARARISNPSLRERGVVDVDDDSEDNHDFESMIAVL